MKNKLIEWLKSEQQNIDQAIASAGIKYYTDHKAESNFQYDLKQCHIESYNLIRGKDLCYDRPNTAFAYSLWYHPRRINTFLSFFLDKVLEHQGQYVEVFDLGAGAGAIQWSLGLIYAGLKRLGIKPPRIIIINIDTSPFMLNYNKEYLWKEFLKGYPEIDKNFYVEYEVNSWNNDRDLETSNPILAASYLFDASDNIAEIANDFKSLVNKYNPNTVLLLTSNQEEKKPFINSVVGEFRQLGFNSQIVSDSSLIFRGYTNKINELRTFLGNIFNIAELSRKSFWTDNSHYGVVLQKPQSKMSFTTRTKSICSLDIYNPPITVRREVTLNDKQKRAARNTGNPVVIVGPAGCGKSIVITEKIKNILDQNNYSPDLKILVTTFNKELIEKLSQWLRELLDKNKYNFRFDSINEKSSHFTFNHPGNTSTNIRLIHFDMLPKKLAGVRYRGLVKQEEHFKLLEEIVSIIKKEEKISNESYDNILSPDFLFEEYNRVIYGLQIGISGSEETYLNVSRKGRGRNPSLEKNSYRRKLVFKCLQKYATRMHIDGIESFTIRRQYFYSLLKKEQVNIKYDYIFVDEFQDCTRADVDIFFKLLKPDKQNNFTLAGDLAQAVHLGTSARADSIREVIRDGGRRGLVNIQWHYLNGSYRLPVRISEAIKKISEAINTRFNEDRSASIITPYKCSPPGSRPIIVFGETYIEVSNKVKDVFNHYKIFDLSRITILEKDELLKNALIKKNINAETDTILRLKGLEKECILWSTWIPLKFEKEVFEFAYTIVTRTSCILIVAINNNTQNIYKKILGLLNRERLIMWDSETEHKFNTFCEKYVPEQIEDED